MILKRVLKYRAEKHRTVPWGLLSSKAEGQVESLSKENEERLTGDKGMRERERDVLEDKYPDKDITCSFKYCC